MGEFGDQVCEVREMVEASEVAMSAVREELMTGAATAGKGGIADSDNALVIPNGVKGLEDKVKALQEQVSAEVEALREHQQILAQARQVQGDGGDAAVAAAGGGGGGGGGGGHAKTVELAVEDL